MKKEELKTLASLYISFVKIGGFTLGGGYAMIPIIQHEAVDKKKWVTEEEMSDFITIGQSLPGIIGINTATTVGNKAAGIKGAAAATLGMITPSIIVIILIAMFFDAFQQFELVQRAFSGVRAAVAALIFIAVIRIVKTAVKNLFHIMIAIFTCAGILILNISPPYMLIASGLAALLYKIVTERKSLKEDKNDSP